MLKRQTPISRRIAIHKRNFAKTPLIETIKAVDPWLHKESRVKVMDFSLTTLGIVPYGFPLKKPPKGLF